MYVLIVDDELYARAAIERILLRAGHRVCMASTGMGALRQMRGEKPELVLLDMMLGPEMSGWEVADEKRRDGSIASIPTVVLSGLDPQGVRLRGISTVSVLSEVKLILQKPVSPSVLLQVIEHIGALKKLEASTT
jgi:CheY-like chemotaxis protein